MKTKTKAAKFELGRTVTTRGVADKMEHDISFMLFCGSALHDHHHGEWGDLSADDKQANEDALLHGDRILSAYNHHDGTKIWVITESDRSVTTILFPDEY